MILMALIKKIKSPQQQALDESADAKEYFYKILMAKKNNEPWARDIPLDMNVLWGDEIAEDKNKGDLILKNEKIYFDKLREDLKPKKDKPEEDEGSDLPF